MFWGKKLVYYFFFIAVLLGSFCANAMEADDAEEISGGDSVRNSMSGALLLNEAEEKLIEEALEATFEPITSASTKVPESLWQIAGGCLSGALCGGLSTQFLTPSAIKALEALGVTKDVIPSDTWYYTAGMAIIPAIAGFLAGYGVKEYLTHHHPM